MFVVVTTNTVVFSQHIDTGLTSLTSNGDDAFGNIFNGSCLYEPWFCQLVGTIQFKKINQVITFIFMILLSFQ